MSDNKRNISVSIILPTYNRAGLLPRAIDSVMRQSYKDWELIIVDDASTDETPEIIKKWAETDYRITVITNVVNQYPDLPKNLNKGLAIAKGKYIARLDDDDYWIDSQKLEKQVDFLEKNKEYVIVGTGMIVIDEKGEELYRYLKNREDVDIRKKALFANPFSHTTVLFRADAARLVGGYSNWDFAEDWDLWLKLGRKGKFYNVPEYSTAYLSAGQNNSYKYQRRQAQTILKFITVHRKEYPYFYFAFMLNVGQLIFSLFPEGIRRNLHNFLSSIKRKI
ncbi:MAG: putative glycosyltransferase EpsE [Candidatus Parcubacteria bacterium]|jgi:glycosyltransferase involved in cell wall biosynthesis